MGKLPPRHLTPKSAESEDLDGQPGRFESDENQGKHEGRIKDVRLPQDHNGLYGLGGRLRFDHLTTS